MAIATITTGVVTSWAGTENSALITGGSAPSEFTLNMGADEFDTTALSGSGVTTMAYLPGMYNLSGTIRSRIEPMRLGTAGFITASSAYLTNLRGWTMNLVRQSLPADVQTSGAAQTYRAFLPSLIDWNGTWTAFLDDTTAAVIPGTSYSATFRLIDDTTDHTLAGTIITTGAGIPVRVGNTSEVTYNYRGSGAITAAGSGAVTRLFPTSPIPSSAAGSLVLQAVTSRTYTMSAFWTRIGLNVPVDGPITVDIDFQGTGAVTIA